MNDDDRTLTRADKQDILDHITRERRNGDNYVDKQLSKVNGKIDKLQEDMTQVKRDVRVLKADVAELKTDVNTLAKVVDYERDTKGQLQKAS